MREQEPTNIILSSKLEGLSTRWPFFREPTIQRVLFCSQQTPKSRLKKFSKFAKVFLLKKGEVAPQVVRSLNQLGISKLLVEGGGEVMCAFVKHGLIEEFNVTLTPWILGGKTAPTLVDGEGFSSKKLSKLKLVKMRKLGSEIFLVYRLV